MVEMDVKLSRICPSCNNVIYYNNIYNLERAIKSNNFCRSCCTTIRNKTKNYTSKELNPLWKGYREIPYNWFSRYFLRGKKKNKRIGDIQIEDVYNIWIKQHKKCALSGVNIGFYDVFSSATNKHTNHSCSIDRIDSSKEYTIDNIQLVHKDINIMKNKYSQTYFIKMCKLIVEKEIKNK